MDQSLLLPEVHLLGQKLKAAGVSNDLAARVCAHVVHVDYLMT